ncbi:MarR family winged helix-turn-helix transcriptional regulator [Frankia sp. AiPa1]|uniref:MarR family winged helix-turn-helix transcriptional regulator n=1 Tax=Frankia sp. AiPa1 TaxID=573492 RepID=UPI00202B03F3|nr:MarR family winged helix-turn-helix transcriptional regulator [Frankia sp. AiPa1]MCL9758617.1 MarR family winged helix-turn-helix transcriptional regulator [Frankia sp. AiPa1]
MDAARNATNPAAAARTARTALGGGGRPHVGTSIDGAPLGSLLLQVLRIHARLGDELLRQVGVTVPHEIVLLYLEEHGPVPQTELVHYLGRDRSTVTATLQAMERAGLVQRGSSPDDGRIMIVSLARRGAQVAPAARAAWHELERHTTRRLTAAQREELAALLTVVRDTLADVDPRGTRAEGAIDLTDSNDVTRGGTDPEVS